MQAQLQTPRMGRFGEVRDLRLASSLPFELKPASFVSDADAATHGLASVYASRHLRGLLDRSLRGTIVSGLQDATFQDIADVILSMGATGEASVYVFGGFLRDAFKGAISDDIDILFRSRRSGGVVPFLESVAAARGWPCYRKTDEKSGVVRSDFIAIGDKGSRSKFSGHTLGSGCEGDFACNTLLYDIRTGTLIDPTGHGMTDAVEFVLRIPVARRYWEDWLLGDRLLGMKLLRYFNFCGRGYAPASSELRAWIVDRTNWLFRERRPQAAAVVKVFFNRKIYRSSIDKALKKEAAFRAAVISEFARAAVDDPERPVPADVARRDATAWYHSRFFPLYGQVKKTSMPGVHDAMDRLIRKETSRFAQTY